MRLRRSKNAEAEVAQTEVQSEAPSQPAGASGPDAAPPPATSGPGPVRGLDPDPGPRPPITGTHPVASPPAPREAKNQRAWLADLDRRLGTRTYAGAAAVVLSLAASIVAIVLAIDARDNSAGIDDLARVESQLSASVTQAGETALQEVNELSSRLSTLEDRVDEIATAGDGAIQRIRVVEDDIDDLRQQISNLAATPNGAAAGAADTNR